MSGREWASPYKATALGKVIIGLQAEEDWSSHRQAASIDSASTPSLRVLYLLVDAPNFMIWHCEFDLCYNFLMFTIKFCV